MGEIFWLPFFKKGVLFFFEKKNQKTFTRFAPWGRSGGGKLYHRVFTPGGLP
jgi:hypothetical protein